MVILNKKVIAYLRDKKILLAQWDCESKTDPFSYPRWYLPFKGICNKITLFCPKKNYFQYGKIEMSRRFLELIKKEKPDFVLFLLIYDEFDPEVFLKIKEISPNTKLINVFSDDYWRYEDFGVPYSIFFDYIVTILSPDAARIYKKDGLNAFLSYGEINTEEYHPMNLPKKYNVGFIGRPSPYRVEFLRFLIKNNVDVNIWGNGWKSYPDLEKNYHGTFNADKWSEIINQIRINLNFSMTAGGKFQLKGRPWEIGACKSFVLGDYFKDYTLFFKENKEMVFFRNKEELLNKVRYFISHEKEREKIAEAMHRIILKKYNLKLELNQLFEKIILDEKMNYNMKLLAVQKRVIYLSKEDMNSGKKDLTHKIKNFDYVCFIGKNKIYDLKEYIQAYSLEKSKKPVSCCDYYVNSKKIGVYLLFKASLNFMNLSNQDFNKLLVPEQLMIDKNFFLDNLDKFKIFFNRGFADIINKDNTAFLSIPLIEVNNIPRIKYSLAKKAFQMKFLDRLYSLKYQKKLFSSTYAFNLFFEAIHGKFFIIKALKEALLDKGKIDWVKKGF